MTDRLSSAGVGTLLVTNDDGIDSPALLPLLRALAPIAPVRAIVPSCERSWISKAITRFGEVVLRRVDREGFEIHSVDGFPADCTNLGVHSLFDEPPDMVVSGINIGLNTGLGFFLSSGTVGAASEAWIAGIPAIAFSVGVPWSDRAWKAELARHAAEGLWERASELSADLVRCVRELGYPDGVDLLNVNFPLEAGVETPRVVTELAAVGYGSLFREERAGVYVHDFAGRVRLDAGIDGTDLTAVENGCVSITPVRLAHAAKLDDSVRRALERRG